MSEVRHSTEQRHSGSSPPVVADLEQSITGITSRDRLGVERTAAECSREWMRHRACADKPTSMFFPEIGHNATEAKAVCNSCPVRAECLAYAMANREEYGVWGGTAPWERWNRERPRPRQHPPVARCGSDAGYYRHLRQTNTEPCQDCREAHAMAARLRKHTMAIVR